jgi:hypothetical protein
MVAWNALPAILPQCGASIGGLETGAWTLATGLSQYTPVAPHFFVRTAAWRTLPYQVSGVHLHYDRQWLRKVRNDFAESVQLGPPLRVKRFHPNLAWQFPLLAASRWVNRLRGVQLADYAPVTSPDPRLTPHHFDAWAGFGVNADSARVAATAAEQGTPMLLFLESNADLDQKIADTTSQTPLGSTSSAQPSTPVPSQTQNAQTQNAYGEHFATQRFAIEQATVIVCQSQYQQRQLAKVFSKHGPVIRNPIAPAHWQLHSQTPRKHILWIGRYDSFHKRTPLAFEIARRCPQLAFRMIINRHDPLLETALRGNRPANVELVDYVPFSQMPLEFSQAQAFLCTGSPDHEGFPNVLLQAAAAHTPICSLADFDDFLANSGAGVCCQESIETAIACLQSGDLTRHINWSQVDDYLAQHHAIDAIARQTTNLLQELLAGPS